jgi:hypothetical protein
MRKSRFLSRIVLPALFAASFATAAEAAPQGCTPPGAWATRTPYTNTISRAWGAFYPPDGKFYLMGGRPDDVAGDDFIQVHIYDPATTPGPRATRRSPTTRTTTWLAACSTSAAGRC